MADPEKATEGWTQVVGTRSGFLGCLGAIALAPLGLALWVVTLPWLRLRWADKAEARAELQRLVTDHEGRSYAHWADLIEKVKGSEFTTKQGNWYQAEIEVFWDSHPGGTIRVVFAIDDGGRSAFFPMTDSLLIEPPEDEEASRVVETSPAVGWLGIMLFLGLLLIGLRWLMEKVA